MGTFDSKKFKDLKAKWDQKLTDSGFEDIEAGYPYLKPECQRGFALDEQDAIQDYYRAARQLCHAKFEKALYKSIWTLHADGLSIRQISAKKRLSRDLVFRIIKGLRAKFGLKEIKRD